MLLEMSNRLTPKPSLDVGITWILTFRLSTKIVHSLAFHVELLTEITFSVVPMSPFCGLFL